MNTHVGYWRQAASRSSDQNHKTLKHSAHSFRPTSAHFDHVYVDILGPLPISTGLTYFLTCVDRYTCGPKAAPLPEITEETVAPNFVQAWISRFCCPSMITTDRGRHFQSVLFASLVRLLNTHYIDKTAYHPRGKSQYKLNLCRVTLWMTITSTRRVPCLYLGPRQYSLF